MDDQPYEEDFHQDYFPTSAKPVFVRIGLLILLIISLCLLVYWLFGGNDKSEEASEIHSAVSRLSQLPSC